MVPGALELCLVIPKVAVQAKGVGVQKAGRVVLKADCPHHVPGCVSTLAHDMSFAADGG